ncbi:MAG: hypothetical protein N4A50_01445 [Vallitalea sp.]|nr:hypothetical protein [Vallitalea sp.]
MLFSNSSKEVKAGVLMYSIIETAKTNGFNSRKIFSIFDGCPIKYRN